MMDEWAKAVPGSESIYEGERGWAVYDGTRNLIGRVEKDGRIIYNGSRTAYKEMFLKAAKARLCSSKCEA